MLKSCIYIVSDSTQKAYEGLNSFNNFSGMLIIFSLLKNEGKYTDQQISSNRQKDQFVVFDNINITSSRN